MKKLVTRISLILAIAFFCCEAVHSFHSHATLQMEQQCVVCQVVHHATDLPVRAQALQPHLVAEAVVSKTIFVAISPVLAVPCGRSPPVFA